VSDALPLDTHIALWLDAGDERLKPATRGLIDGCWQAGGTIFLSAVSAWEIAVLVDRGHIQIDLPLERRLDRFRGRPGVRAVPLGHGAAIRPNWGMPWRETNPQPTGWFQAWDVNGPINLR